jgi:hypothetical protein
MGHKKLASLAGFQYEGETWDVAAKYGIQVQPGHPSLFVVSGEASSPSTGKIFGQMTDMLLAAFPSLREIISLHLRDAESGEPLGAAANGWFWFVSVKPDGTPREKCIPLPEWAELTGAERAAAYLDCDPALFADITPTGPDDDAARLQFNERLDALRPIWERRAQLALITYDLEV